MSADVEKSTFFADHWLLGCLSESEAERLLKFGRLQEFPTHAEIFRQGDPGTNMMAVVRGRVKITSRSIDGKEIILNIIDRGEIFGEMAVLTRGERSADAVTLEPSAILVIERRDLVPILERNPKLCLQLLEVVCRRLQKTSEQVEETVFLDRSAKLAKALLRLARDYGRDTPEGAQIDLKLSQREIGQLVGLTRESMNKQLAEWRERGIVSVADGLITIRDRDSLEDLSVPD